MPKAGKPPGTSAVRHVGAHGVTGCGRLAPRWRTAVQSAAARVSAPANRRSA
ncbi:hypothetical protein M2168_001930 [Streptomyces sp. CZ24]|nr:hypothetical protein [Streptomyces sp. CZ24]